MTTQKDTDYEKEMIVFRGRSVSIRQLMEIGWATAAVDVIEALAEYGLANGDMCILLSVHKMRKMSLKSDASALPFDIYTEIQPGEERFKYVDPKLDEAQAWKVHFIIKRLVKNYSMADISRYLWKLEFKDHLVLLPTDPQKAFDELERIGMPKNEKGFTPETYRKYHKKLQPINCS